MVMRRFDFFFFQAEDGIRDIGVTGVQTCALPICAHTRVPTFLMVRLRSTLAPRLIVVAAGIGVTDISASAQEPSAGTVDRKSGVEGKRVDLGGRRNTKKKTSIQRVTRRAFTATIS